MIGNDFQVTRDEFVDGVRYVTATPSGLVCSSMISFEIHQDGTIHKLKYERGCHGNLQATGLLVEGKSAAEVAAVLNGVDCHGRGTSCTDQLSRIIATLIG